MARITCKCGSVLSNVGCPNTLEGEIKGIYEYKSLTVWCCRTCGRLLIDFPDPEVKGCHITKSYFPEDGIENVFAIGTGEDIIEYLKEIWDEHKEEFLLIDGGAFD